MFLKSSSVVGVDVAGGAAAGGCVPGTLEAVPVDKEALPAPEGRNVFLPLESTQILPTTVWRSSCSEGCGGWDLG